MVPSVQQVIANDTKRLLVLEKQNTYLKRIDADEAPRKGSAERLKHETLGISSPSSQRSTMIVDRQRCRGATRAYAG